MVVGIGKEKYTKQKRNNLYSKMYLFRIYNMLSNIVAIK